MTYYIDAVRQGLKDYMEENKYIDYQVERYERLYARVYDISAQQITDMPRAPSPAMDRMTDKVVMLETLDKNIREQVEAHHKKQNDIEKEIKKLKKADEKTVIQMRYLDCMCWKDIVEMMFSGAKDYEDKYESYERRMYIAHSNAIEGMAENVQNASVKPSFIAEL